MKDRVKWQKETYSRFWTDQVKKYGFDSYCKGLCKLIENKNPSSVYELAIGTGWPFAITFHEKGIKVSGSDISDILIEEINTRYPGIKTAVSSYEDIKSGGEKFDIVYCFRSTWYFPNVIKALDAMFSLVQSDGSVIFDIMNKDSSYVKSMIRNHRIKYPFNIIKNILKKMINVLARKNYLIQDPWNIHDLPISAKTIEEYLLEKRIPFKKYSINQITDGIEKEFVDHGELNSKVVFDCRVV